MLRSDVNKVVESAMRPGDALSMKEPLPRHPSQPSSGLDVCFVLRDHDSVTWLERDLAKLNTNNILMQFREFRGVERGQTRVAFVGSQGERDFEEKWTIRGVDDIIGQNRGHEFHLLDAALALNWQGSTRLMVLFDFESWNSGPRIERGKICIEVGAPRISHRLKFLLRRINALNVHVIVVGGGYGRQTIQSGTWQLMQRSYRVGDGRLLPVPRAACVFWNALSRCVRASLLCPPCCSLPVASTPILATVSVLLACRIPLDPGDVPTIMGDCELGEMPSLKHVMEETLSKFEHDCAYRHVGTQRSSVADDATRKALRFWINIDTDSTWRGSIIITWQGCASLIVASVVSSALKQTGRAWMNQYVSARHPISLRLARLGSPHTIEIHPLRIYFTQDSISDHFQDGGSISDLVLSLCTGSIEAQDVGRIRVCWNDGRLYSLDNRRLAAFILSNMHRPGTCKSVTCILSTPTPEEWSRKFTTQTEGATVLVVGDEMKRSWVWHLDSLRRDAMIVFVPSLYSSIPEPSSPRVDTPNTNATQPLADALSIGLVGEPSEPTSSNSPTTLLSTDSSPHSSASSDPLPFDARGRSLPYSTQLNPAMHSDSIGGLPPPMPSCSTQAGEPCGTISYSDQSVLDMSGAYCGDSRTRSSQESYSSHANATCHIERVDHAEPAAQIDEGEAADIVAIQEADYIERLVVCAAGNEASEEPKENTHEEAYLLHFNRSPKPMVDALRTGAPLKKCRDALEAEGFSWKLPCGALVFCEPHQHRCVMKALNRKVLRTSHVVVVESLEYLVEETVASVSNSCHGAWVKSREVLGKMSDDMSSATCDEEEASQDPAMMSEDEAACTTELSQPAVSEQSDIVYEVQVKRTFLCHVPKLLTQAPVTVSTTDADSRLGSNPRRFISNME
eukprot:TRINITY_DN47505_c0_g1_i1.p1 TRINITY_DN47505_c0_g1~~TRINITY_DN47505_c0_g1_i1.p1  ORF type:complete len:927 (-),score=61.96 TRINITY_DN47505_c0_g1_i1:85-2802(-)